MNYGTGGVKTTYGTTYAPRCENAMDIAVKNVAVKKISTFIIGAHKKMVETNRSITW